MKYKIDSIQRTANALTIEDGSVDEFCFEAFEIVPEARAQVIEHAHVGAALKMFDDVTANEPGAAGNQDSHSRPEDREAHGAVQRIRHSFTAEETARRPPDDA